MHLTQLLLLASYAAASPAAQSIPEGCPLDNCLYRDILPPFFRPAASAFCTEYLGNKRCTKTQTATKTATITKTHTPAPKVTETTTTITSTIDSICTTTATTTTTTTAITTATATATTTATSTSISTVPLSTSVDYVTYQAAVTERSEPRAVEERAAQVTPSWFTSGCKAKNPAAAISAACECFIGDKTITSTETVSKTITHTAATAITTEVATTVFDTTVCTSTSTFISTSTATTTSTTTSTATLTTSTTVTSTITQVNTFTCGQTFTTLPTVSASGSVTCSNNVPAPTENALFRIEGNDADGTIFEGCIVSEPQVITTPSGGSHECDGTNNGANSSPGATATDQIASAGQLIGFGFDGTFDSDFDDFFITSIGNSMETSTEFWGLLQNGQFTPSGGCQTETTNTDVTLWAFNAFNAVYFLQVTPEYAVVEAGSGTITVTITDAQTNQPVPGSVLGGQTADSNGHVTITIPANQGCYQMKATQSDAIRSNAFYLTVVDSFGSNPSGPF